MGLKRCRFGELCRSFQPPYPHCSFIHPGEPDFEYARGAVISSSDGRSRKRVRTKRSRNSTSPPSSSSRGPRTPPRDDSSRGRDSGWSSRKMDRYSRSRSPEYRSRKRGRSPAARSRSPRIYGPRTPPRRSSPPPTTYRRTTPPRQPHSSPPREPRAHRSSPSRGPAPTEPSFARRRLSLRSSPTPVTVKTEPVEPAFPRDSNNPFNSPEKERRRRTEAIDLTTSKDAAGPSSRQIKTEQPEQQIIINASPPPPPSLPLPPIETTPHTVPTTTTMPPPPSPSAWGHPPQSPAPSREQKWDEMLRLASKWIGIDIELREIEDSPKKAEGQKEKDRTLARLTFLSSSPATQGAVDTTEAQAILALISDTKTTLAKLKASLEAHQVEVEQQAEQRKAEKRRRLEEPSKRESLRLLLHEIDCIESRFQDAHNMLIENAQEMELQTKQMLDALRRAAANPANKPVNQMQNQLKSLEDEIAEMEKEMAAVDSEYTLVTQEQVQVDADLTRFQSQDNELKRDLAQYRDLLSQLEADKRKQAGHINALSAAVKSYANQPTPFSPFTVDHDALALMVQEEVEQRLARMSVSVQNDLREKSQVLHEAILKFVWVNLGPALTMCDALTKNTLAIRP